MQIYQARETVKRKCQRTNPSEDESDSRDENRELANQDRRRGLST